VLNEIKISCGKVTEWKAKVSDNRDCLEKNFRKYDGGANV
jgi:hypothetical protein